MDGFACVFCARPIHPTFDRWLWLQVASRKELLTAHRTCYESASAERLFRHPGPASTAGDPGALAAAATKTG